MTPDAFPWERAIGLGLGLLRLSPDAFWRMTPRELALALAALTPAATPPIDRNAFAALRARFPDRSRDAPALKQENRHG